jgi:hypothetical protein
MKPANVITRAGFRDPGAILVVVLALSLIGAAGWWLFARSNPEPASRLKRGFTHIHCPSCGDELAYDRSLVGEPCNSGEVYVATVGPSRDSIDEQSAGRWVLFSLVSALTIQGATFLVVWRLRSVRQALEAERARRIECLCPYCQRKVRYPASRGGTGFACAKCKTAFVLPAV